MSFRCTEKKTSSSIVCIYSINNVEQMNSVVEAHIMLSRELLDIFKKTKRKSIYTFHMLPTFMKTIYIRFLLYISIAVATACKRLKTTAPFVVYVHEEIRFCFASGNWNNEAFPIRFSWIHSDHFIPRNSILIYKFLYSIYSLGIFS